MILSKKPFENVVADAHNLVTQMSLEEKASLCSGLDFWHTKAVERLKIPSLMVTDGPHGLRKQAEQADHLGINNSVLSTCFPTAVASTCSFDSELLYQMGVALGEECRQEDVAVILGPAANIKRSPLCGRNFEYISEDPLVTGETAAALIAGVQSKNVGTSLKHYLANNQEKARLTSNSIIDERTLREIYLTGFEIAVKKSQPWTLMCSYNKINGTYASDNRRLMTEVPRGEWGFGGAILTDWGAMNDRIEGITAGLDLEMPANGGVTDKMIVDAVRSGKLDENEVDICAERLVSLALQASKNTTEQYDIESHNQLARKVARESAVLLKLGKTLPAAKTAKVALIGEFADKPRYQGAGSSKICPHKITSMCDAFTANGIDFVYSEGYHSDSELTDDDCIKAAVGAAEQCDVVFAVVGLPDSYESEGFDRTHLNMPENQNKLMDALVQTGKPVVAVMFTGSVVDIPWRDRVDSILLMNLSGQNVGEAAYDLLFGDYSPCGKLAETFPLSLGDTPSIKNFGGNKNVEYREGIYVGYRYYDKAGLEVMYPFGYGLSYTTFAYSNLVLSENTVDDEADLTVSLTVQNTGSITAKEVVQLYVAPPESTIYKAVRELRSYAKVELAPGESKVVTMTIDRRAFAYWNVNVNDWFVESGDYGILIGSSSRDLKLSAVVHVDSKQQGAVPDYRTSAPTYYAPSKGGFNPPQEQFETVLGSKVPEVPPMRPFNLNSTLGEIRTTAVGEQIYQMIGASAGTLLGNDPELQKMIAAMIDDMPLRQVAMMSGGEFTPERINGLLETINATPSDSCSK